MDSVSTVLTVTDNTSEASPGNGPDTVPVEARTSTSTVATAQLNLQKTNGEMVRNFADTVRNKANDALDKQLTQLPGTCADFLVQKTIEELRKSNGDTISQDRLNQLSTSSRQFLLPRCQQATDLLTGALGFVPPDTTPLQVLNSPVPRSSVLGVTGATTQIRAQFDGFTLNLLPQLSFDPKQYLPPYTPNFFKPDNFKVGETINLAISGSMTGQLTFVDLFSMKGLTEKGLGGLEGNWSVGLNVTYQFGPGSKK